MDIYNNYYNADYEQATTLIIDSIEDIFEKSDNFCYVIIFLPNNDMLHVNKNGGTYHIKDSNVGTNCVLEAKVYMNNNIYNIKSEKIIICCGVVKLKFFNDNGNILLRNV